MNEANGNNNSMAMAIVVRKHVLYKEGKIK